MFRGYIRATTNSFAEQREEVTALELPSELWTLRRAYPLLSVMQRVHKLDIVVHASDF